MVVPTSQDHLSQYRTRNYKYPRDQLAPPHDTFYTELGNTTCLTTTQFTVDCQCVELEPRLQQNAGSDVQRIAPATPNPTALALFIRRQDLLVTVGLPIKPPTLSPVVDRGILLDRDSANLMPVPRRLTTGLEGSSGDPDNLRAVVQRSVHRASKQLGAGSAHSGYMPLPELSPECQVSHIHRQYHCGLVATREHFVYDDKWCSFEIFCKEKHQDPTSASPHSQLLLILCSKQQLRGDTVIT